MASENFSISPGNSVFHFVSGTLPLPARGFNQWLPPNESNSATLIRPLTQVSSVLFLSSTVDLLSELWQAALLPVLPDCIGG